MTGDQRSAYVLTEDDINSIADLVTAGDPRAMQVPNGTVASLIAMLRDAEAEREALLDQNALLRVDVANAAPDHEALANDAIAAHEENEQLQELLGCISLYVKWRWLTKQLTTEQKEMWADVVDAWHRQRQIEDGEGPHPVAERWWRDDFVDPTGGVFAERDAALAEVERLQALLRERQR